MGKFTTEDVRLAQESEAKYGVPASVTLAQYALESGYGTSNLGKVNNNYFGVRAGSTGWKVYGSKAEAFDAHGKLLAGDLYSSKTADATNAEQYVKAIAETYAPSSDGNSGYAEKIMKIIDDNDLTRFDSGNYGGSGADASTIEEKKSSGISGKIAEIGSDILSALVYAVSIILVCVLAVVFFMNAFDMEIPSKANLVKKVVGE